MLKRWRTALEFVLILALAAVLVKPMFKLKFMDKWDSIEGTFISDARFLRDHWPHPQWQPLWYCGTRFDYVYPPALRYGTAVISKVGHVLPVKAYHIYAAFFFALGIAGVYLLVLYGGGSHGMALLAAFAAMLLSPSFLLFPDIRRDAWQLVPQRLGVLIRYGEGPHMTALSMMGFALAFAFRALPKWRPGWLAASAIAAALVVSNNFYGATAMAMLFPILVWAFWITHQDNAIFLRGAAIGVLAYLLTAFWLTPSYFFITLRNMQFVSMPGTTWSLWIWVLACILYVLACNKWVRGRPEMMYRTFLAGCVVLMGLNVIGNQYFGFRVIGEPGRLIPELDLVLILALAEVLRTMWWTRWKWAAAVLATVAFATSIGFVRTAWRHYPLEKDVEQRLEFRLTKWMWENRPTWRAHTTGSVRFWNNTWFDGAELGGASEQGLTNVHTQDAQWNINLAETLKGSLDWMQAMGVDMVVAHLPKSKELHHDITHTEKFATLPVLFDDGEGNVIYEIPRRWRSLARVVWPKNLKYDAAEYANEMERGIDARTTSVWRGTDALDVHAKVDAGQALVVQVSYDPAWHAYAGTRELAIRQDPMEFMLIDAPPGEHDIRLVFETPLENKVGRVFSVLGFGLVGFLFVRARKPR